MVVEALSSCEAGVPASIHPSKGLDLLEKRPRNLARPPTQIGSCRKKSNRSQEIGLFFRNLPVLACLCHARGFSTPLARRRSNYPPPSLDLALPHLIARVAVRLRVMPWRPNRLYATVPLASSRLSPPLEKVLTL